LSHTGRRWKDEAVDPHPFWSEKPRWCRPWTIVSTGGTCIAASWLLLHRTWITVPVALAVLLWWWVFLVAVPSAYLRESGRKQG
jgi:hypothetical protein